MESTTASGVEASAGAELLKQLQQLQQLLEAHVTSTMSLEAENAWLRRRLDGAVESAAVPPAEATPAQLPLQLRASAQAFPGTVPGTVDLPDEGAADCGGPSKDPSKATLAATFDHKLSRTRNNLKKLITDAPRDEGKPRHSPLEKIIAFGPSKKSLSGRVFADSESLKEHLQDMLTNKNDRDDFDCYYSDESCCGRIARSHRFEMASMAVVAASSLWIAVEMDANPEPSGLLHKSPWYFQAIAHSFCAFFVCELVIRFLAFREKTNAFTDPVFIFDAILVIFIVLETWIFTIVMIASGSEIKTEMRPFVVLRILRLFRVLRLGRVLRQLPELLVIVRGIGIALKAISVVITLIFFIVYVMAIVLNILTDGMAFRKGRFDSVALSIRTLLLDCTLSGGKGITVMKASSEENLWITAIIFFFVLISNVTMMEVMTGLLVQTVKTTAEVEKEESQLRYISDVVDDIWKEHRDYDKDGLMSEDELLDTLGDSNFSTALHSLGVDVIALLDVSGFIFEQYGENRELSKKAFKKVILNMRGKTDAKVKDHVETRKYVHAWIHEEFAKLNLAH